MMKHNIKHIIISTILAGMSMQTVSAQTSDLSVLSQAEQQGLVLMREEEKLARDVYAHLYKVWGHRSFDRITQSENRHMNAVQSLLTRYRITDPVTNDKPGVFNNLEMTTLYQKFVKKGEQNLLAALQVGAELEELDIADLIQQMELTDEADILRVYENLVRGSRNHLRAFMKGIEQQGGRYQPQHLSAAAFQAILDTPQEQGRKGKSSEQQKNRLQGQATVCNKGKANNKATGKITPKGHHMGQQDCGQ